MKVCRLVRHCSRKARNSESLTPRARMEASVKVRRGRREGDGTENVMTERPSRARWFVLRAPYFRGQNCYKKKQKNCFSTVNLVKITKQSLPKHVPSHVLLQTGTKQWQQHRKENVLV